MIWWLNAILIGLLSFFTLGLGFSEVMAAPMDQRSVVQQSPSDDSTSLFTIAPELTNPAETPISETESEPVSPKGWFEEVPSSDDDADSLDANLGQWLSSVKNLFTGQ